MKIAGVFFIFTSTLLNPTTAEFWSRTAHTIGILKHLANEAKKEM